MLLYKEEREQFQVFFYPSSSPKEGVSAGAAAGRRAEKVADKAGGSKTQNPQRISLKPSEVYGGEHLLRLFSKFIPTQNPCFCLNNALSSP